MHAWTSHSIAFIETAIVPGTGWAQEPEASAEAPQGRGPVPGRIAG